MTNQKNKGNIKLTETEKQKTPLTQETDPKDAFAKAHAIASRLSKQLADKR